MWQLLLEFMELWTTIHEICCTYCKMVTHTNILDISTTSIYINKDITIVVLDIVGHYN